MHLLCLHFISIQQLYKHTISLYSVTHSVCKAGTVKTSDVQTGVVGILRRGGEGEVSWGNLRRRTSASWHGEGPFEPK